MCSTFELLLQHYNKMMPVLRIYTRAASAQRQLVKAETHLRKLHSLGSLRASVLQELLSIRLSIGRDYYINSFFRLIFNHILFPQNSLRRVHLFARVDVEYNSVNPCIIIKLLMLICFAPRGTKVETTMSQNATFRGLSCLG